MNIQNIAFSRLIPIAVISVGFLLVWKTEVLAQQKQTPTSAVAPNKGAQTASVAGKTPPPVTASGSAPIELRMKFKPNDLSRYQMTMQADLQLPSGAQTAGSQYSTNLSMVIQQKVIKLRPDGGADVAITTLSGEGTINQQPFKPDISGKPSIITFDTRNNIVGAKDLPQSATGNGSDKPHFSIGCIEYAGRVPAETTGSHRRQVDEPKSTLPAWDKARWERWKPNWCAWNRWEHTKQPAFIRQCASRL